MTRLRALSTRSPETPYAFILGTVLGRCGSGHLPRSNRGYRDFEPLRPAALMTSHVAARPKYSVGTKVRLLGEPVSNASAAGEFVIISRHFLDTEDPRYRIRNLLDRHERSVGEDDIFISVQASPVEDGLGSKVVPFRALRPGLGRS